METIYKIFPRYYRPTYTDEQIQGAVNMLRLTCKEDISCTNYHSVQFIDCGDGLQRIFCPWCGRETAMDFWRGAMDKAFDGNAFDRLGILMPCCDAWSSLDELVYVKPCGFATFVVEVRNPAVVPCGVELHEMGKCFGNSHFFRMISAGYEKERQRPSPAHFWSKADDV